MLDEGTSALLKYVNEGCQVGAYKIFTLDDFSSALGAPMDEKGIENILSCLQEDGYLAVKYAGGGMYCVGLLPLGAEYSNREELKMNEERKRMGAFVHTAFFGGFLGGVTGGFFSAALALLVSLFFRK